MGNHRSSVNVAKTMLEERDALVQPSGTQSRFESKTKMEPRWEADGVFLGRLDLSDEVIVGTTQGIETTRSFEQMPADQQRIPDSPQGYRGFRGASSLIHLEEFANVASRDLWCKSTARQTVAQPAKVPERL